MSMFQHDLAACKAAIGHGLCLSGKIYYFTIDRSVMTEGAPRKHRIWAMARLFGIAHTLAKAAGPPLSVLYSMGRTRSRACAVKAQNYCVAVT